MRRKNRALAYVAVSAVAVVAGLAFAAGGFAIHQKSSSGTPSTWSGAPTLPPATTVEPAPAPKPTTAPPTFPQHGEGTFRRATGSAKRVGSGTVLRYRVEVERGLEQQPGEFAKWVDRVLADPRGWTAGGQWAFQRPAGGSVDFVVKLASPDTVDQICGQYGLDTGGEVSCRGQENVVINVKRWVLAIPAYQGDVDMYRHLVVNHEVGHFLGHSHVTCPGKGRPAPVMQQQIYGMGGCVPNGWPYPRGRKT
ncbi:DUF3152 domain-containing protein [Phytohabitans sp. ZYX-F-186]|uniref:DUF3152 domain-containing protein n=1 Tax=Phytohabitans maris TaxID=3071409 RepID=A0ABU0ZE71_9ACTN|nr:DUF3152 domain-containing protein [Phytohabitans sp. ZYX-F-186]MDQ7905354.1 DUF3152 domain-containing protein [Phytohabitans sp. ZYX-F-186]